jgi:hypothetical protein
MAVPILTPMYAPADVEEKVQITVTVTKIVHVILGRQISMTVC